MRQHLVSLLISSVAAHTGVVHLGSYPDSVSSTGFVTGGTLTVHHVDGANLLQISGIITGLQPGSQGGWHIHTGYKCVLAEGEDASTIVGGHYFPQMVTDPWTVVKYTADQYGVAEVSLTIKDFTLMGRNPVMGRAVVVHDSEGVRVGCGVIEPTFGEVVTFDTYPGYTGASRVKGQLIVSMTSSGSLTIEGTVAGLPASQTGGWHVHTGASCSSTAADAAYATGGHYYPGMATDPWDAITYTADTRGAAKIVTSLPGFSLYESNPVIGHAVVVHDPASMGSTRSGCGLVGTPNMGIATIVRYPGATGAIPNRIGGTLRVKYDEPKQMLSIDGLVTGLTAGDFGGWHVHTGFSCTIEPGEVANTVVGGHYWEGSTLTPPTPDPWKPMAYVVGTDSVAHISVEVPGFSLTDGNTQPVLGRAIVIHNEAGTRVGCGLIEPFNGEVVTFDTYPGYTGTSIVKGLLALKSVTGGSLSVKGTLSGLVPSQSGGWHVHTGYTCGPVELGVVNDVIGGHYYPGKLTDPWDAIQYTSDVRGVAQIGITIGIALGTEETEEDNSIEGFSLYETNPVAGRAMVIHDPTGPRAACGLIGSPYSRPQLSYVSLGNYPGQVLQVDGAMATIAGTLTFEFLEDSQMLAVRGVITGLNASTTGGWHIHTGFTCDVASYVGGHYYLGGTPDSWKGITYTADSNGVADITTFLPGFSLAGGPLGVNGHSVVIHNSFGSRIGCGVIEPSSASATVMMTSYPGTSSQLSGVLVVKGLSATMLGMPGGLSVVGTFTGLPKNAPAGGGWHIHSGYTCEQSTLAADGVFGHYYEGMGSDPWTGVTYGATDSKGVVQIMNQVIPGFSLSGQRPVDLRSVVVHDPNTPANRIGCGSIGAMDDFTTATLVEGTAGGFANGLTISGNLVSALHAHIIAANADYVEVIVLWMRVAHPALVAVGTALLIAVLVILMFPGFLLALGVGYCYTYAYGGVTGTVGGAFAFGCGTFLGSIICFLLGGIPSCKKLTGTIGGKLGCFANIIEALAHEPLKLICLLRASPVVPFNVLNYYAGSSGRFKTHHVIIGHLFTAPLSFMFVGLGGAIVKYRMVMRGEASQDLYMPFIWAGLILTIVLFLAQIGIFYVYSKRVVKRFKAKPPPGPSPAKLRAASIQMDQIDVKSTQSTRATAYASVHEEASVVPPPPPPEEPAEDLNLQEGWRPVLSDEGETYYFNDETGESQWDPPLAGEEEAMPAAE